MSLPPLLPWEEIQKRLEVVYPEGVAEYRNYLVGEAAAKSIFAALYIGAVQGTNRWMAPRHLVRMDDGKAADTSEASRLAYYKKPKASEARWYEENSREIRDDVWRKALIPLNGMVEKPGVTTNSSEGRYALPEHFAELFDPVITDPPYQQRAEIWGKTYLSAAAKAKAAALRATGFASGGKVVVAFPNGDTLLLQPDESAEITKRVCEDFAIRFLAKPAVVWISHSASKKNKTDEVLRDAFKLTINTQTVLPDVLLVDLEPPGRPERPLFIFIEVVATDGPVDEQRKGQLIKLVLDSPAGYQPEDAIFVTAFMHRAHKGATKAVKNVAWGTFAWFVNEPGRIAQYHDEGIENLKLSMLTKSG